MSEQVYILRTAPEERHLIHEFEVARSKRILSSSWLKLLGQSLVAGTFPKRVGEIRENAKSNIEYQEHRSKRYAEENLPALKILAKADAEADGKVINLEK